MEMISKTTAEALGRYYNSLFKFGYKNYADVEKLIILIYLEDLLSKDFLGFVTEEDYNNIVKAFYTLLGSNCMIDYPSFPSFDSLHKNNYKEFTPRIDGNGIFRICENSLMRVKM